MNLTTTGNEVGRKGNATSEEQPGGYELEERPFHLFRPSKDHTRLELVYETVQLLRKITKPICIITVVGKFLEIKRHSCVDIFFFFRKSTWWEKHFVKFIAFKENEWIWFRTFYGSTNNRIMDLGTPSPKKS